VDTFPLGCTVLVSVRRGIAQLWPLKRGRSRLAQLLFPRGTAARATFSFRYGTFVDAPIDAWPSGYRDLFLFDEFELDQVEIWASVLKLGDVVVDGGANLGYWSMVASSLVGSGGHVLSFEPHPKTFRFLSVNVAASGIHNICPFQAGLWQDEGLASMEDVQGFSNRAGARISVSEGTVKLPGEVRVTSLDRILRYDQRCRGRRIALIKLDVEGSELGAVRGMRDTLNRDKPILTIEWNWETAQRFGFVPGDVRDLLSEYGYRAYSTRGGSLAPFAEPRRDQSPMVWYIPK
jgi:FkbM family methyltransferase